MSTKDSKLALIQMKPTITPTGSRPNVFVGEVVEPQETEKGDSSVVRIRGAMTCDLMYMSLHGKKKLRVITSQDELRRAREDETLRVIPQMGQSEFSLLSVKSLDDFTTYESDIPTDNISVIVYVDSDSTLGRAFYATHRKLRNSDDSVHKFLTESIYDYDAVDAMLKMQDPEKAAGILVRDSIQGKNSD